MDGLRFGQWWLRFGGAVSCWKKRKCKKMNRGGGLRWLYGPWHGFVVPSLVGGDSFEEEEEKRRDDDGGGSGLLGLMEEEEQLDEDENDEDEEV